MAAELRRRMAQTHLTSDSALDNLLTFSKSNSLNVLELGSGIGTTGIVFAQLVPRSKVLLTDVADAMEILDQNIELAKPAKESTVGRAVLDWEEELPTMIQTTKWDIILISDCTYNVDTIPALANTLRKVVDKSPAALIVIATKVRHESEAIFFDMMKDRRFTVAEQLSIVLPDKFKVKMGTDPDKVHIYIFENMDNRL